MTKKVVVEGEYKIRDGHYVSIEFFKEEFILDDAVKTKEQARSIIKKGLIFDRLRKTSNFKGIRTCQVVSFEDSAENSESGDLDKLLIEATELNCIPENINNYKRADYKIKALEKAIDLAKKRVQKKTKSNSETDLGYID